MRTLVLAVLLWSAPPPEPLYEFTVERATLTMPDGVRLSPSRGTPRPTPAGAPEGQPSSERVVYDPIARTTTVKWTNRSAYMMGRREYRTTETEVYRTSDLDPAASSFDGEAAHAIRLGNRRLELRTAIRLRSDTASLHLTFTRTILENGRTVRTKRWVESFPRTYH